MDSDERNTSSARRARKVFAQASREPLVQFLTIALVLFGANHLIHGTEPRGPAELITVSHGRVQQIADSYRLLAGRLPSRAELQALVNDFTDEEIAYREAVAMGLDTDDTIVRRRMRQKLEFLAEDADASEEPTDEQLAAWLREHAAEYRLPERISFRHVLASSDAHGARADAEARAALDKLRLGADHKRFGDPSMLPSTLPPSTQEGVAVLFGEGFAATVFTHRGKGWFGPVASPLGAHAVLVVAREAIRDPALADIRDKLRSDWREARRKTKRAAFQARLRERYRVVVEWPDIYARESNPIDEAKLKRFLDSTDSSGE
jgi:hypothetical protein